jgi:aminoglycoside phosphotransferase (APT) family kinase protein
LTGLSLEMLARIPGLESGQQAHRIDRLGGGTVNEVFRVDTSAGRFVVRLNGAQWRRPGVDRIRELQLHRAAATAGVAPTIVAAEPSSDGLLIMEYEDGHTWTAADYRNVPSLTRLGERLGVLHAVPPPQVTAFDPLQVAQSYAGLILEAPDLRPQLQRLQSLCERLTPGRGLSVIHGDLWEGNLLDGSRLWLLDWEYAQLSDPLMDIACLLAYYPEAVPYRRELAAAAGLGELDLDEQLFDRVTIYRTLSWLWHLARGRHAPPPCSATLARQDW